MLKLSCAFQFPYPCSLTFIVNTNFLFFAPTPLIVPSFPLPLVSLTQHQDQLSSKETDGSLSKAANSGPQGVQVCATVAAHCKAPEVQAIFGGYCAWAQGIIGLLPKLMPHATSPLSLGQRSAVKKGTEQRQNKPKGRVISGGEYGRRTLGMKRGTSHSLTKRCRFPCQLSPKPCTKGWLICR